MAVTGKLQHIHDMEVLDPDLELTGEQKKAALEYLMFVKEKKSGDVKVRRCADGRPH